MHTWYKWFLFLLLASCHSSKDPCTRFQGEAMSMPYQIVVGKKLNRKEQQKVKVLIQETFSEVDARFNNWNPRSEISQINAASSDLLIPLSPPMDSLLSLCDQIVNLSGGRFDPTVGPLQDLWRHSLEEKKTPSALQTLQACDALGWKNISIKNGILKKSLPSTQLDLCGISKGLCIDWIIERLNAHGFSDLFVEWGGEIRALGHHPERNDWVVSFDPGLSAQGKPIPPLSLKNKAIAMSGDKNQKGWILPAAAAADGQIHRFFPLIDPLSAQPLEKTEYSIASVTVIASSCALADALATAAMLFPGRAEAEKWAQEVVELYPDVSFWILSYKRQ